VLAWGINDFGQLGSGSTFYETSPTKVVGLEDVRIADIVAGGWHSLALTTEGGAPPPAHGSQPALPYQLMQPAPAAANSHAHACIGAGTGGVCSRRTCPARNVLSSGVVACMLQPEAECSVCSQRCSCGAEGSMVGWAWGTGPGPASCARPRSPSGSRTSKLCRSVVGF
jgi:hypothetical protein